MIIFIHSSMGCWWWPWMTSTIPVNLTTNWFLMKICSATGVLKKGCLDETNHFWASLLLYPPVKLMGNPRNKNGVFFHKIIFSKWRISFTPFFLSSRGIHRTSWWRNPLKKTGDLSESLGSTTQSLDHCGVPQVGPWRFRPAGDRTGRFKPEI